MIKKHILIAFACTSFFNQKIATMERNELLTHSNYPILKSESSIIKRPLSCEAIRLSEAVQVFRTDNLKIDDISALSCTCNQLLATNTYIIPLLSIVISEIFEKENTLTLELVKPIFANPIAIEALLDLANEKQKENLLVGKLLMQFLIELENESEEAKNLLSQTRALFISLGILKPELDTFNSLLSQCPVA